MPEPQPSGQGSACEFRDRDVLLVIVRLRAHSEAWRRWVSIVPRRQNGLSNTIARRTTQPEKQPPFLKQGRFVAGSLPPFPATRKPFPPPWRMVVALASPVRNGISANRALASKAPNSRVPRFGNDAGNEMLDPRTRTPLGVQPERTRAARLPPPGFCGYPTPHEMNGVAQSPDHPASSAESDGGAP